MRNNQESEHEHCNNILDELDNCGIFFLLEPDEDIQENEIGIANDYCIDDPLILTKDELRMLGQQLIEIANAGDKNKDA